MAHRAEKFSVETSCDALLIKALRLYQEVETLYQSMPKDLAAPAVMKAMTTVETINALLRDGQIMDNHIAEILKTQPGRSASTKALLDERNEILERIHSNNQEIAKRAENVKSLLRHEITSLSTSHHAIKGYKPAGVERQYIVRDSF